MIRDIIEIDETLCTGCGACIPNCHQGALQIIDGKARLISDLMCEGMGACVGHCPTGAMTVVKREAEPYDEVRVLDERILPGGRNTLIAHLNHLDLHKQSEYLAQAYAHLESLGIDSPELNDSACPGSRQVKLDPGSAPLGQTPSPGVSKLRQWPVQLHLLSPNAPFLAGADLLVAADCTAFATGNFHGGYLEGKALAIACPKLDQGQEMYVHKLIQMIDQSKINTISVLMMEVPCCSGLLRLVQQAQQDARRKIPVKEMLLSLEGELLRERWV